MHVVLEMCIEFTLEVGSEGYIALSISFPKSSFFSAFLFCASNDIPSFLANSIGMSIRKFDIVELIWSKVAFWINSAMLPDFLLVIGSNSGNSVTVILCSTEFWAELWKQVVFWSRSLQSSSIRRTVFVYRTLTSLSRFLKVHKH